MSEKGRIGVITTNDRKEKYTDSALTYFNMNAVHFVEGFVCSNTYEDANERSNKVKAEFKKQLLQFQKNVLLPANSWEIAKVVYTGKLKAGMKDDLVMTLLFTTFWAAEFLAQKVSAPYQSFI